MTPSLRTALTSRRLWAFVGSLAIIALVALAFFYPDATEGNVLRQHDMQQGIANGHEAQAFTEATGETTRWTNSLFGGMPTFQISPSYPSSRLYSWINTVMQLGLPQPAGLIAMMMIGFLILLTVMKMRWWIALLGAIAYGFSTYFVIIIGAGHLWKFITLAYIPPTIASIMLCYRGRYLAGGALAALFAMMQIASNHIQMTYYFLYVILAVVIAFGVSAWHRHTMRQFGKATGALTVAALLAVTACLPNLYNTWQYSKESMRGLHSALTKPATEQTTSGLDKNYITQYSYQPSETFSLLIPDIKGGASLKPEKGSFKMLTLSELPEMDKKVATGQVDRLQSQYADYMSQYFGDPEGTNGPVYVGALIFALFLLGCVIVRGPLKWALLAVTVLSILLAWGRHAMIFTDIMLSIAPMYSKFRTVESILVIAEFTMPLLAAMALQQIFSSDNPTQYLRPMAWTGGITATICIAGIMTPSVFGSPITDNDRQIDQYLQSALMQQGYDAQTAQMFSLSDPKIYSMVEDLRLDMVRSDSTRSLAILIVGGVLILLFVKRRIGMAVAAAGLVGITLIDLFTVNKRYLDHDSFVEPQLNAGPPIAMTKTDRQILADTSMNYRVLDIPRFYQADPSYYHKTIGGYHAAKLTRYQDLIDRNLSHFTGYEPSDADWNVANMLNARYIVDHQGQLLTNPEALGNAWFVSQINYVSGADAEMDALQTIDPARQAVADIRFKDILGQANPVAQADTIYETSYAPNRLTYHSYSAQGGVAVLSEIYFPWGWEATVDGQPVEIARVNYLLRALRLPPGHHTVTLTFDPASVRITDTAATIAIILIYLALLAAVIIALAKPSATPQEQ